MRNGDNRFGEKMIFIRSASFTSKKAVYFNIFLDILGNLEKDDF
jgi:hypothetical protein